MLTRRSVLFGLLAAPVVVRSGLIMPVKALDPCDTGWVTFYRVVELEPNLNEGSLRAAVEWVLRGIASTQMVLA